MNIKITPAKLAGVITPPPSKSQAHRLLIAACLAGGEGRVANVAQSEDITATLACMAALNAPSADLPLLDCGESGDSRHDTVCHDGAPKPFDLSPGRTEFALGSAPLGARAAACVEPSLPHLDCGESGSTLRFLIPVALALRGGGVFTGRGRLMERPQEPYFQIFREKGIAWEQKDGVLTLSGRLTPGVYTLPGDVSSQFITGLLYALPLLPGPSEIRLTTDLESAGYVDMTLDALARFGIKVGHDGAGVFTVPGGQTYVPCDCAVEADWSQAGFWYAARGLGNAVEISGMNPLSHQGDRVLEEWAGLLEKPGEVVIDLSGSPDLAPPIAAWAALRAGQVTQLVNAARLRIKESDRLATVTSELKKLGADIEEGPDYLVIRGVETLRGGEVLSHNDHRIAMMAAIAATRAAGSVVLHDAGAVKKSYPGFWDDYAALGGKLEVLA